MKTRWNGTAVLVLASLGMLCVGVGMLSIPAALITAGVIGLLIAVGDAWTGARGK